MSQTVCVMGPELLFYITCYKERDHAGASLLLLNQVQGEQLIALHL